MAIAVASKTVTGLTLDAAKEVHLVVALDILHSLLRHMKVDGHQAPFLDIVEVGLLDIVLAFPVVDLYFVAMMDNLGDYCTSCFESLLDHQRVAAVGQDNLQTVVALHIVVSVSTSLADIHLNLVDVVLVIDAGTPDIPVSAASLTLASVPFAFYATSLVLTLADVFFLDIVPACHSTTLLLL